MSKIGQEHRVIAVPECRFTVTERAFVEEGRLAGLGRNRKFAILPQKYQLTSVASITCRSVALQIPLRDSPEKTKDYLILNILAASEIGGFSVLLVGFFLRLWA